MGQRKTTDQFKSEVFDLAGTEYEVLDEYIHAHHKLRVRHTKCGYIYSVTPGKFLQGRRCPKCNRGYTLSTEEFKKIVYNLVKDEFIVLGEYKGIDYKILMKHKTCGYQWDVTPKHFQAGSRCPRCIRNLKRTQELFENEVFKLVGEEYTVLGEYENTDTPILIRHNACEAVYAVAPSKFLRGGRCPDCMVKHVHDLQRKTTDQFKAEVFDLVGDEFEVISDYKGAYKPIHLKHTYCKEEFELSAARNFLVHPTCRICTGKESKGEKIIRHYIERQGWNYKAEYRFNDCRDRYPLPFDFAVFNDNQELKFLIEYDGQGHYQPVEIFGAEKGYQERLQNDQIKEHSC